MIKKVPNFGPLYARTARCIYLQYSTVWYSTVLRTPLIQPVKQEEERCRGQIHSTLVLICLLLISVLRYSPLHASMFACNKPYPSRGSQRSVALRRGREKEKKPEKPSSLPPSSSRRTGASNALHMPLPTHPHLLTCCLGTHTHTQKGGNVTARRIGIFCLGIPGSLGRISARLSRPLAPGPFPTVARPMSPDTCFAHFLTTLTTIVLCRSCWLLW